MLEFSKNLQYLTVASDKDTRLDEYGYDLIDHDKYFRAIRDSGQELIGLRFDTVHRLWPVLPAPGMHELSTVRFLETHKAHIERLKFEPGHDPGVPVTTNPFLPDIECPFEQLLPPNIEVLKVTPNAKELGTLCMLLIRKHLNKSFLPHLRRMILVFHFRDELSASALRHAVQTHKDNVLNYARAEIDQTKDWPLSDQVPDLTELKSFARRVGVEIIALQHDMAWQEILNLGAGPAVWEIPQQIAPLSAEFMAVQQDDTESKDESLAIRIVEP